MDDLVKATLQKGGIDGANRLHAGGGQASRKGDSVSLRNAHIKEAVGIDLGKAAQAGPGLHSGGNSANAVVLFRQIDDRFSEHLGKIGAYRCSLALACANIKGGNTVEFARIPLGIAITSALLGDNVQQNGSFHFLGIFQKGN